MWNKNKISCHSSNGFLQKNNFTKRNPWNWSPVFDFFLQRSTSFKKGDKLLDPSAHPFTLCSKFLVFVFYSILFCIFLMVFEKFLAFLPRVIAEGCHFSMTLFIIFCFRWFLLTASNDIKLLKMWTVHVQCTTW